MLEWKRMALVGALAVVFSQGAQAAGKDEFVREVPKAAEEAPAPEPVVEKPVKKATKAKPAAKAESKDASAEKKADVKAEPEKKAEKKEEKKPEVKAEEKKPEEKKADKKEKAADAKESVAAKAPANALSCPLSVDVDADKLDKKSIPEGFSSFAPEVKHLLQRVDVYADGKNPEPIEPSLSTADSSQWQLSDNGKQAYALVCSYSNTSVALKKVLDKSIRTCRIDPMENPANPRGPKVLLAFSCK